MQYSTLVMSGGSSDLELVVGYAFLSVSHQYYTHELYSKMK